MVIQFANLGRIVDIGLGVCWTPADLELQVQNRVAALAAAGVKPRSIVLIAHSGSARFLADLFAVWSCGCAAACIDPNLTPDEIKTLVEFVEPSAVLVDDMSIAARIGAPILNFAQAKPSTEPISLPASDPGRPALILFTSGTTGNPKGVVLSSRALFARISLNCASIGAVARSPSLVTLPMSFGHGLIGNALTPLLSGGDIVLHPLGLSLAQNLGRIVDQYRIGFLSSVPAFWRIALKFSSAPTQATLLRVHMGSAPLPPELWANVADWSGADVINCYGVTELANWVAGASSRTNGIGEGRVGRPWGGQVRIKDSAGNVRDTGDGELLVKSPSVMSGYLHRPDLTAAALIDGWYHTGDTGHIAEDGVITLTGRIKDEINRAGFKVQPLEIEILLESHSAVSEACVFGIEDEVSGEIVAAAVCPKTGRNISIGDLQKWCATRMRREAVPERWFVLDTLPRSDRGKLSRDDVRKMLPQTLK